MSRLFIKKVVTIERSYVSINVKNVVESIGKKSLQDLLSKLILSPNDYNVFITMESYVWL